jgi:hypothetical protein
MEPSTYIADVANVVRTYVHVRVASESISAVTTAPPLTLLESQDPEVEQHSSSTHGPTIKGQAETESTDTTKQARVSLHVPTKLARLRLHDPLDDVHTSS